ncbi:MAG: hypothetical protein Q8O67_30015 [Deltaproteobacteria bacterium]|nr:hypothetical protein [Deltaproteobacteria bacterium]
MLKKTSVLAVVIALMSGCPAETAEPECSSNSDCTNGEVCVAASCISAEGEPVGEGEGEGEPPDLTPRLVSQQFILGAPKMRGNTFQVHGRVAVVPSTTMRGSTFRVISIH